MSDARPTLRNLMRELREEEAQWRDLGVHLGVSGAKLDSIHATKGHLGQSQCMMDMLQFWLNYEPSASWALIVAALRELQKHDLVKKLEAQYLMETQKVSSDAVEEASTVVVTAGESSATLQRVEETDCPIETQRSRSKSSFYKMNKASLHGTALIINNIEWKEEKGKPLMEPRTGAEADGDALQTALKKIRYQVIYKTNLTKDRMIEKLKDVRDTIRPDDDSFICCLLSHGGKDGVYGIDKELVSIEELSKILEPENCPALKHKPKIFFVQACRGTDVSEAEYDASAGDVPVPAPISVPQGADFFVSYATDPSHIALRHPYPQFLSEELVKPDMSLTDIVMEVHRKLAAEDPIKIKGKMHLQIGQVVQSMRGRIYFQ